MLVYYCLLFFVLVFSIFENKKFVNTIKINKISLLSLTINKRIIKKSITLILFFTLLLISTFRNITVGIDLKNYISYFNECLNYNFNEVIIRFGPTDLGYYLLIWLIANFTDNNQIFLFITSIIPLYIIFKFFYEESKIIWLSVFLFISIGNVAYLFNLLRQIISMSIIICGYKHIKNKKILNYIMCVLIAMTFHSIAIFCLPIYFFAHNKLNFINYIKYLIMALIIITSSDIIINFFVNQYQGGRYMEYIISGEGYKWLIILIGILLFGLVFKKQTIINHKYDFIIYNIFILSVLLQLVSLNFSLFVRIVHYYSFFITIFIPNIINSIKDKFMRILSVNFIVVFFSLFFMYSLQNDSSGIVPYSFFWMK